MKKHKHRKRKRFNVGNKQNCYVCLLKDVEQQVFEDVQKQLDEVFNEVMNDLFGEYWSKTSK